MLTTPAKADVKLLNQQHSDYSTYIEAWKDLDLLYTGGEELRLACVRFLRKRPAEFGDVWNTRQERFTYENLIGTIFGWYTSAEFKKMPDLDISGPDGSAQPGDKDDDL